MTADNLNPQSMGGRRPATLWSLLSQFLAQALACFSCGLAVAAPSSTPADVTATSSAAECTAGLSHAEKMLSGTDPILAAQTSRRAIEVCRRLPWPKNDFSSDLLSHAGRLAVTVGDYRSADQLFQQALHIRALALPSTNRASADDTLRLALVRRALADPSAARLFRDASAMHQELTKQPRDLGGCGYDPLPLYHLHSGSMLGGTALAYHYSSLAIPEALIPASSDHCTARLNNLLVAVHGDVPVEHQDVSAIAAHLREELAAVPPPPADRLAIDINFESFGVASRGLTESIDQLSRLLDRRSALAGAQHPGTAESRFALALALSEVGQYDLATLHFRAALRTFETIRGEQHPDSLATRNNLANTLAGNGDYASARQLYEAVLRQYGDHGIDQVSGVRMNLGNVHHVLGDFRTAHEQYEKALAGYQSLGVAPSIALLNNLAVVRLNKGEIDAAADLLMSVERQGLNAILVRSDIDLIRVRNNRGVALLAQHQAREARVLFEEVNDALVDLMSERCQRTELVEIDEHLGHWRTETLPGCIPPRHPEQGRVQTNLSRAHQTLGDLPAAAVHARQAVSAYVETLGLAHPDAAYALYQYGVVLSALDRLREAIVFGKLAVNALQSTRASISSLDRDLQQAFVDSRADIYREVAGWLMADRRLYEAEQILRMLKEHELYSFTRGGLGLAGGGRATCSPRDGAWCDGWQQISKDLMAVNQELATYDGKEQLLDEDRQRIADLSAKLDVARKAFDSFLSQMEKDFKRTRVPGESERVRYAKWERRVFDGFAALRQRLEGQGSSAAALYYLATERRLHIVLVTPKGSPVPYSVPVSRVELSKWVLEFRRLIDGSGNWLYDARDETSRQLFSALFPADLQADLATAGVDVLLISLDDDLRYLPLAALSDGDEYLIERYALSLFTPAVNFRESRQPKTDWRIGALAESRRADGFGDQLGGAKELCRIVRGRDELCRSQRLNTETSRTTDGVLPGRIWIDDEFSASALADAMRKYPIVHIYSHFDLQPDAGRSRLLIGVPSRIEYRFDSRLGMDVPVNVAPSTLTLLDLTRSEYRWENVDLAVFAACETAIVASRKDEGEEVEGLAATIQKLGAASVVGTLWKVPDEASSILMHQFYTHASEPGVSKARALQLAQLDMLRKEVELPGKQDAYRRPYWWAGFALTGNWR